MRGFLDDGVRSADDAPRFLELLWLKQLAAFITLVSSGVIERAVRAGSSNVPVSKEVRAFFAERPLLGILHYELILVQVLEDVLRDLFVIFRRGSAENIEIDVEPLVHLVLNVVVLCADFSRRLSLLSRLHLSRSTVLVCSAHIERLVTSLATIPGKHISAQHAPDDRAEVRSVVYVWESTRDEDVSFAIFRKDFFFRDNATQSLRFKKLTVLGVLISCWFFRRWRFNYLLSLWLLLRRLLFFLSLFFLLVIFFASSSFSR